jgi:steroid 5-alpha reductase family enzyme
VIYLFSAAATGRWLSVTIIGAVLLSVLFIGSTRFTEQISSQKYPEYADYQRRTSPIIPWTSKR